MLPIARPKAIKIEAAIIARFFSLFFIQQFSNYIQLAAMTIFVSYETNCHALQGIATPFRAWMKNVVKTKKSALAE
jgi:hypothetical protein